MNIVLFERMAELSENRSKFYKIRKLMHSWKAIVFISILFLTAKVASEQLIMLFR